MNDGNSKITKNIIYLYIRMAFTMVVSFITVRVTLQVLGSEDYGLNNLVGSIVSILSFLNGSMGTAVQRYYSFEIGKNNQERLAKVYGVAMYLHLLIAIVTVVLGELFAIFFLQKLNIPENRMFAAQVVYQLSLASCFISIVVVPYFALLRAREEFSKVAILDIFQAVARLIILYLLCTINYDKLIVLAVLNFIITVLYQFSIVGIARKYPETKFQILRDKLLMKEMIGFISFLLITVLLSLFRDQGIVLIINIFFGLAVNAGYAIANQINGFVNSFVINFKSPIVPQLVSSYSAGNYDRMNKLINTGTKITFLLLLAITVPIMLEPNFLLGLWLHEIPPYTVPFVILILININISSFTYFLYQAVHATGNIKLQQILMSVLYVLNVVLIFVVYKLGGTPYSALYVTICISILQCIVNLYCARKTFKFDSFCFIYKIGLKSIITLLLSIVIPIIEIIFIPSSGWRFCIVLFTYICMLVIIAFLYYFTNEEKSFLYSYIMKIKQTIKQKLHL